MSAGNFGDSDSNQDVDLNLAPIIDSFVVLISFMLVSAAFISIGLLDAGISAGGVTSAKTEPPPVTITVFLEQDLSMRLQVTGKEKVDTRFPSKQGAWDFDALTTQLDGLKRRWATVQALTLQANDRVEYKNVIQALDKIRPIHPAVLLGGF